VFRVGDDDAKKLAEGFAYFEARDLRNLETGQAVARVERSDFDFNLTIPLPVTPDEATAAARRQEVITCSRKKYGTTRADIETQLAQSRATLDEPVVSPVAFSPPPASKPAVPDRPLAPPQMSEALEPPKPAKPPVKEDTKPPKTLETIVDARLAVPPRDLGRGGAQHQAVQQRLKHAGEELGFRAIIEKQILDGQGSIDLLLDRADTVIACEISITTTIDHEVGNVAKCLKAEMPNVAVICLDEGRLQKIAMAVANSLGSEAVVHVHYFLPDAFIAYLKTIKSSVQPAAQVPVQTEIRRGYKIKRIHFHMSPEELKAREDAALKTIAETMRNKKKR
jgi:hypothetical protein